MKKSKSSDPVTVTMYSVTELNKIKKLLEDNGYRVNYDYLATCGPSMKPLINYVQSHPNTDTIYLGFDNDEAGNKYS